MLMGKLMSGKKYHYYEYVTAIGIWIGMAMFQFFTENKHSGKQFIFIWHRYFIIFFSLSIKIKLLNTCIYSVLFY